MKNKLLLSFLLPIIICSNSFTQPALTWQRTLGGKDFEFFSEVHLTDDHGLIIGGSSVSDSSNEKTQNSRGKQDYWIVKLDSSGKIQWDKTIGGSEDDVLNSLAQTTDGGYILGGWSESNISGEKTANSKGRRDFWVVKLNNAGTVEWDKTIGGDEDDEIYALQQTKDGGYILGGISMSGISGDKSQNSIGGNDYWLVKLNGAGAIEWDRTYGGNDWEYFRSLEQTSDNGYILGGWSWSGVSGDKTDTSRGGPDYWIIKTDNAGNIQWDKTVGAYGEDDLYTVRQTPDGGYILGGTTSSRRSGDKSEISRGSDYWVVKLDNTGAIQWDNTIGGDGQDYLSALALTKDGGYILTGTSGSDSSHDKTENGKGSLDYWVVKLNRNGKVEWDKTIGGAGEDWPYSIQEISRNHYALGGNSLSGISGDKLQLKRGRYDYWIVKIDYNKPPNGQSKEARDNIAIISSQLKNNGIVVYPNPVKNILYVHTTGAAVFTLINLQGKIMCTSIINEDGFISVSGLKAGLYVLKNNKTGNTSKVVVIK